MNENNDEKSLTQIRVENDKDITNKPEEGTKIKAKDGKEYMAIKEAEIGWFRSNIVAVEQNNFQNRVRLITGWSYYFWGSIVSGIVAVIGIGVSLLVYFKKKNKPEQVNNNSPSNSEPEAKEPKSEESNKEANNPSPSLFDNINSEDYETIKSLWGEESATEIKKQLEEWKKEGIPIEKGLEIIKKDAEKRKKQLISENEELDKKSDALKAQIEKFKENLSFQPPQPPMPSEEEEKPKTEKPEKQKHFNKKGKKSHH